jgi:hypothetical protein
MQKSYLYLKLELKSIGIIEDDPSKDISSSNQPSVDPSWTIDWKMLMNSLVWTIKVVIWHVFLMHTAKMAFSRDHEIVKALFPD